MAGREKWPLRSEFDVFVRISDAKELSPETVERWWRRLGELDAARRRAIKERRSPAATLEEYSADLDALLEEYSTEKDWWQELVRVGEKRRWSSVISSRASTNTADSSDHRTEPKEPNKPAVNVSSAEDIDVEDPAAFVEGTVQVVRHNLEACRKLHELTASLPGACTLCFKRMKTVLDEGSARDGDFQAVLERKGPG
eukprot:GGOE01019267.1.p3 GENE.GGOE01019267.1~~GGOE01019267.1.p3  ORF type:complete len:215 (+),score=49.08 GGOE01019267.1:54-647(+)